MMGSKSEYLQRYMSAGASNGGGGDVKQKKRRKPKGKGLVDFILILKTSEIILNLSHIWLRMPARGGLNDQESWRQPHVVQTQARKYSDCTKQ